MRLKRRDAHDEEAQGQVQPRSKATLGTAHEAEAAWGWELESLSTDASEAESGENQGFERELSLTQSTSCRLQFYLRSRHD
jgi:hypothetical protein